jgi:S-adenosylmethionine:tRNA-ribosyltransferase-isomerase (queuine synthetase)
MSLRLSFPNAVELSIDALQEAYGMHDPLKGKTTRAIIQINETIGQGIQHYVDLINTNNTGDIMVLNDAGALVATLSGYTEIKDATKMITATGCLCNISLAKTNE